MIFFFQIHPCCGLHDYILSHFYFLFVQQEAGEPALERHQTGVTQSVFTTSPTACDTGHIAAVPAGRDQGRKANSGTFNSMEFFLQVNLAFSLDSKLGIKLTSRSSLIVDFNPYL